MVPGLAPGPEPRLRGPGGAFGATRNGVTLLVAGDRGVGLLGHEVRGGGVEEQQVNLQTEHLRRPVEDLLLQRLADLQQPVHRPVAGIIAGRRQPRDQHVLAGPAGSGQLRGRRERPVRDQGEQHPLRPLVQAAALQQAPHRRADAQPLPQRVQHVRAAQRPGLGELQPLRRDGPGLPGLQVPGDGRDQPLQRLPGGGLLPAEVVDNLHLRPLRGRVPHVVSQLQVADLAAVLVPPRRRPQVHILDTTPLNQLSSGPIVSVHVSMNLPPQQPGQSPGLPHHAGTQTRRPPNCGRQGKRTAA